MSEALEPPGSEYLTLARELSRERDYEHAMDAYERAFVVLRSRGHADALVIGQLEAAATVLELGDLPAAERHFALAKRDAALYGVVPTVFSIRLMELMIMVERGDEQQAVALIEAHLMDGSGGIAVDEALALMQLMGKIYDRNAAPLRAASFLMQQCEILEHIATTTRDTEDMAEVASAYFEHARYLHTMLDVCVLESNAETKESPQDRAEWDAFLAASLRFDPRYGELTQAIRHEVLRSLDASDWWGGAPRRLRFDVGVLRTAVLLELDRTSSAAYEAKRIIPIGEAVGAPELVAYLKSVAALGRPDIDYFGR